MATTCLNYLIRDGCLRVLQLDKREDVSVKALAVRLVIMCVEFIHDVLRGIVIDAL